MTDHSISLLGCPFCAADCAELTKAMGEAWIRCPHCDATGGMSSNEALAIKNWNARALTTASDADERAKELATLRGEPQYPSLQDWLNEAENYVVRAERIPPGAYPWIAEAWKLGAASVAQTAAPDWKQDQAETTRLAGKTGE